MVHGRICKEINMNDPLLFVDAGKGRNELVVVLHGYSGAAGRMATVCETIRAPRPDADIYAPVLPFGKRRLSCPANMAKAPFTPVRI
jgi:hypothetical protein